MTCNTRSFSDPPPSKASKCRNSVRGMHMQELLAQLPAVFWILGSRSSAWSLLRTCILLTGLDSRQENCRPLQIHDNIHVHVHVRVHVTNVIVQPASTCSSVRSDVRPPERLLTHVHCRGQRDLIFATVSNNGTGSRKRTKYRVNNHSECFVRSIVATLQCRSPEATTGMLVRCQVLLWEGGVQVCCVLELRSVIVVAVVVHRRSCDSARSASKH